MELTECKEGGSIFHAISERCRNPAGNHWKIKDAAGKFGEYISGNKWKTATVAGIVLAFPLIAAYLLSPAYARFVNTTAASTYAGMIARGKGLCALAVASPVFTALLTAAIVVTFGTLVYMNLNKANQIDGVKKAVLESCEKNDQGKPELQNEKIEMDYKNDQSQVLADVPVKLGLAQVQTQAAAKVVSTR